MKRAIRKGRAPHGAESVAAISMFVQIDADDVSILRAEAIQDQLRYAQGFTQLAAADGGSSGEVAAGGDLVMAFVDGSGNACGTAVARGKAVTYFDRPDEHRPGALCGGALRPRTDRRLIHVAVPPGAESLLFSRREAPGPGGGAGRSTPLVLYALDGNDGKKSLRMSLGQADLPPDLKRRPFPWHLRFDPPPLGPRRPGGSRTRGGLGPDTGNYIHGFTTLKKCTSKKGRPFNIVIMGDGFADVEVDMFKERAGKLAEGLLRIPPFNDPIVKSRLALHRVTAVSRHSGIDNCPYPNVRKDTYFDIEGNWDHVGYAGYPGTPKEQTIYDAGALIAPPWRVGLYVMLVNTALYGGRGDPDKGIAYASLVSDGETLANLVAHEGAHAIGRLIDEYIGCEPVLEHEHPPNLATEEDIAAGRVPWQGLGYPWELLPDGRFKARHTWGMPLDPVTSEPILDPKALVEMLGLFWGCAYVDPGPPPQGKCDPWTDPRGARYYRPQARCKMRKLAWDFCRPCQEHIKAVIRGKPGVDCASA